MRRCIPASFLLVLSCSAPPRFEVAGRPVHPGAVYELLTRLSDLAPLATSVDIQGCERSDRHSGGTVSRRHGAVWYVEPEVLGERGYFAYWFVGTTSRGVHVLETIESGGGSGIFGSVIFVTLHRRAYWNHDRTEQRWILSSHGEIGLGDRSGNKVSLDGDTLVIRSPEGCEERIPVPQPGSGDKEEVAAFGERLLK